MAPGSCYFVDNLGTRKQYAVKRVAYVVVRRVVILAKNVFGLDKTGCFKWSNTKLPWIPTQCVHTNSILYCEQITELSVVEQHFQYTFNFC